MKARSAATAASEIRRSPEVAIITGVEHDRRRAAGQRRRDDPHRRRPRHHADLDGADGKVVEHGGDLGGDHAGGDVVDAADAERVLRRDGGDNAGAVDAERREGLEVGLDARRRRRNPSRRW